MHRSHLTFFSSTPIRHKIDNECIEMDDFTMLKPDDGAENVCSDDANSDSDAEDTTRCYALEFACIPLIAAYDTVCESFEESRALNQASESSINLIMDYANNVIATPFAFCPAIIIAIFALLGGGMLDCYSAVVPYLPDKITSEAEHTTNYRIF